MTFLLQYAIILALAAQEEPVKIGLLVPDTSYIHSIQSARDAIDEANRQGGYNGKSFELVVRTTEGFWGAGSKESVSLVYDDEVKAIVGSLDGRNAHLAEQVVAKSQIAYVETRATDPTLSKAFVPWFLRIVPNDDQQSAALLELVKKNGDGNIGILTEDQYDTRYAVQSFTRISAAVNGKSPLLLPVKSGEEGSSEVVQRLGSSYIQHLIVPFCSETSQRVISQVREKMPAVQIYGTLAFTSGMDSWDSSWTALEGMMLIHSYVSVNQQGKLSGISAQYTYDGISLLVEAIRHAGPDGESIKKYLYELNFNKGLTGPISFDEMGNRTGTLFFIRILNGKPVIVK